MDYQAVFKRTEIKYALSREQLRTIMDAADGRMTDDEYPRSSVRSIYFDTPDYVLARRSIEKPRYKEKLRIRSYSQVDDDDTVFLEIKKKYDGIVYKRRTDVTYTEGMEWIADPHGRITDSQIENEIEYFSECYGDLKPSAMITYNREAFKDASDPSFRMTLDTDIAARIRNVDLRKNAPCTLLLDRDITLMELKSSRSIPLWLTRTLSDNHIYPTSFSKYGTAYRDLIMTKQIA